MIASVQGGVLLAPPQWQHGSSEQYRVVPAKDVPVCLKGFSGVQQRSHFRVGRNRGPCGNLVQ